MSDEKYANSFSVGKSNQKTVADWYEDGIRIIVKVMRDSHFCVYLGLPSDHPAAGFEYDDVPISCHGGLTFSGEGSGEYLPENYYWYGYDYAHAGDKLEGEHFKDISFSGERRWSLEDVKKDTWSAVYDLKKFMRVAEKIRDKKMDR